MISYYHVGLLWLIMAWYFPWITPVATISNHWPKGIPRVSQGYQLHSACTAETSRGGDHWTAPPSSLPSRSRSTKATCDLRCRWPVPISPGKSMGNSMAKVGSRAIGFMIYLVRWGYIKHQKKLDDVRWGVLLKYNWGAPAHTFFGPQINWQKQVNVYCKKKWMSIRPKIWLWFGLAHGWWLAPVFLLGGGWWMKEQAWKINSKTEAISIRLGDTDQTWGMQSAKSSKHSSTMFGYIILYSHKWWRNYESYTMFSWLLDCLVQVDIE